MRSVSVSQLKARLSEYLRGVRRGEELLITDRGRPVAVLSRPPAAEKLSKELAELVEAGLVTVGTGKIPDEYWDLTLPPDPKGLVQKALDEDREDRV
ncbi:MAG: type II toxin-antitoxin system prevent-host-death family antitoxin [Actinomycetota bacterium]